MTWIINFAVLLAALVWAALLISQERTLWRALRSVLRIRKGVRLR